MEHYPTLFVPHYLCTESQIISTLTSAGDTPEILQRRVMEQAEWIILPQAIDLIANGKVSVANGHVTVEK